MWTEHRFIAFDETPLFYRVHSREGAKAIAILVHGMGEHGGRYQHLGDYLAEFEIESWIPDLRGHGRSGGKPGHISHFSDLHRDLSALHSLIDKTRKGLPIFLVGPTSRRFTASASSDKSFSAYRFLASECRRTCDADEWIRTREGE